HKESTSCSAHLHLDSTPTAPHPALAVWTSCCTKEKGCFRSTKIPDSPQRAETAVFALTKDASTTKDDGSHSSPFKGENPEGRARPAVSNHAKAVGSKAIGFSRSRMYAPE
ncbi:unnamed protein product, partial [Ixodes pacificus]